MDQWDLGLQGSGELDAMSPAVGVIAQVVAGQGGLGDIPRTGTRSETQKQS